jgi:hypothetical protein
LRVASQVIQLDRGGSIADDVIAAGFSLETIEESTIGGDLIYAGYQAQLAGDIDGRTQAAMANCEISGTLTGDVNLGVGGDDAGPHAYTSGSPPPIAVPNVPPGLTIRETAELKGDLRFESPRDANIAENAQIRGAVEHARTRIEPTRPPTAGERALRIARKYGTLLIIGLCLVLIAPGWTRRLSTNIREKPLASFGLGIAGIAGFFALLVAILVGTIMLAVIAGLLHLTGLLPVILVLGITSAVGLTVGFWFFLGYLAKILVGYFAGSCSIQLVHRSLGQNRFLSLVFGLVILALLTMIPYAGPVIGWLTILLALGALVLWMFSVCWTSSQTPPGN